MRTGLSQCITVVMTLLERDGKPGFSNLRGTKTPELINLKLHTSNYVGDITPQAKLGFPVSTGGGATYA